MPFPSGIFCCVRVCLDIGVDSKVSVFDYACLSCTLFNSSAALTRIIETIQSIARSLNAVVIGRKMIQNEVHEGEGRLRLADNPPLVIDEPSVLGVGGANLDGATVNEDSKEEKTEDIINNSDIGVKKGKAPKLCTEEGSFTRCELTIQRIETHLLGEFRAMLVYESTVETSYMNA